MRRTAAASLVLGILGLATLGAAPASATPLTRDVDDFTYSSYEVDYYLDTDAEGRSTLRTVETFVAEFPDSDQNRGMQRAIPQDYQGAPTDLEFVSVTDENGAERPVETDSDDGFLVVTSAADDFVHGTQSYTFTYDQHNVTRPFENTDRDEFYWDTSGTEVKQPIGELTARVHVPAALAESLTDDLACYRGEEGSTDTCDIERSNESGGAVVTASATDLPAGHNVTLALGFESQTFVARDSSYFATPAGPFQLLAAVLSLLAVAWAYLLRRTTLADGRGRPTIIAEYEPPRDVDIVTAAVILGKTDKAAAAEILDLAVRGHVQVIETEEKKKYTLRLTDSAGLSGSARDYAVAIFGESLSPGTEYELVSTDDALAASVYKITTSATKAAQKNGLRRKPAYLWPSIALVVLLLSAVAAVGLGLWMFATAFGSWLPLVPLVLTILALVAGCILLFRVPVTQLGAERRDHLKGLELYLGLAEADRLRVLQSPTGSERESGGVLDVYEKLLPYSVLFGLEKEWAEVLGNRYGNSDPGWYSGQGGFNPVYFAASVSSLSSSVASAYAGSSSSSSSGGSSGSGSSGGGGGGGGAGGV